MTIFRFMNLLWKREAQIKTLAQPIACSVLGCENGEDGTIYCGVRKDGVVVKEDKKNYWVLIDGRLTRYMKSQVRFE